METDPVRDHPDDLRSVLDGADQARRRLAEGLRLPTGLLPALAAAVTVQVGAAAYGTAAQTASGLAVALAGTAVALAVGAFLLHRFERLNGVRVDGLASHVVLGAGTVSSLTYGSALVVATWAAFGSLWWLVATAAVAGGAGYALGAARWWRTYRLDPTAHTSGITPRALAALAAALCVGLVVLLAVS